MAQTRGGSLRGKRGTMCKFESKEVWESLRFHSKSERTGLRKLVDASGVRRCKRRGCGAVSARDPSHSGHSFSLKFLCVATLGEAAFHNVMLVQMWCKRTCGAQLHWGKQGTIAFCNLMLVQMWCRGTCGKRSQ